MFTRPNSVLFLTVCMVTSAACDTPVETPQIEKPIPNASIIVDDDNNLVLTRPDDEVDPDPDPDKDPIAGDSVLSLMGFDASSDEGEDAVVGDVTATFNSPVVALTDELPAVLGSADVTIAEVTRTLSALTQTGAIEDSDLVYTCLFDEIEPWHYVVIAAHQSELVAGTTLSLDGTAAAAIVVDEVLGTGRVTTGGDLNITVSDGGTLSGSLSGTTVEVTLDNWPQGLFPFTETGEELESYAASGAGTFDAPVDQGDWQTWGTASVEATAGPLAVSATVSNVFAWSGQVQINLGASDIGYTMLTLLVPEAEVVSGAVIELSGFESAAYLSNVDGDLYAYSGGTLTIDSADLSPGGSVTGSVVLSDTAYHLRAPCEGPGCDEPIDPALCETLGEVPSTFAPSESYAYTGDEVGGELPPGYDRVLVLFEANSDAYFYTLVPAGADIGPGLSLDLTPEDMGDGHVMAKAVYGQGSCDEVLFVDGGSISFTDPGEISGLLTGTLTADVNGQAYTLEFTVIHGN